MKAGSVVLTFELLEEILRIPEGHSIVAIKADRFNGPYIEMMVEGPTLPENRSSLPVPRVHYNLETEGKGRFSWS